jgi:hypothetical protein
MSALSNFQNGQSFPSISTAMLGTIAQGLNKTDSQAVGGPPPTPRVLESIIDAVTALDVQLNGG